MISDSKIIDLTCLLQAGLLAAGGDIRLKPENGKRLDRDDKGLGGR